MKNFLKALNLARLSISKNDGYLLKSGWIESLYKGKPCDENGLLIPWMNLSVINFLQDKLNEEQHVLEFGGGSSTLFFSRFCKSVTTIEHNLQWYKVLVDKKPENCNLFLAENKEKYINFTSFLFLENRKWDVIVIDGMHRVECIKSLDKWISDSGVVIVDDSSRASLSEAIQSKLNDKRWKKIKFVGLCNGSHRLEETSILYRDNSCFEI